MATGRRELLLLGAAGAAAAAAGFLVGPMLLRGGGKTDTGERNGAWDTAFAAAAFPDLAGQLRPLRASQGKVVACNFWATWCAPCREEIPILIEIDQKYRPKGVEVLGIALDNGIKVREFASSFRIAYPVLLAEAEGVELMRKLGNASGGLPFTVLVDRKGTVVHRKLGAIRKGDLDGLLEPLLKANG